jgi:hypothetical protein
MWGGGEKGGQGDGDSGVTYFSFVGCKKDKDSDY